MPRIPLLTLLGLALLTPLHLAGLQRATEAMNPPPYSGSAPPPGRTATGTSVTATALGASPSPRIDGHGDDPIWAVVPRVGAFTQLEPEEGAAPSHPTEFQVAYEADHLYLFVRAFDPHPDSILRALSRRDTSNPSDEIQVLIDSYHDRRTGYEFAVNPEGVKRDAAIFNDGSRDVSWDGIWEVETAVDSLGWTAEFRIPLSQLRYPDASSHTFGLGIHRVIQRYPERVTWPAISRNRPGIASQLGTLDGLSGLSDSRSIELTPYFVAKSETEPRPAGGFGRARSISVGSDVKLRLSPNLAIDATVNPDFGQVEADPAVLNLDAFEVFVSERRPFFVEGTGLYRMALNCYIVVDCGTNEGLFYSRRIGRAPSLAGENGDRSTPSATPIAGAVKLTGRTAGGFSAGLLNATTREVAGVGGATAEPLTNYAVLSTEQDFRGGEAGVRVIGTAVNRRLDASSEPFLHSSAYAAALSGRNRFGGGNYEVAGLLALSLVEGSPEAIALTQRGSVHYLQQPGEGLGYDPARTSLRGHSAQLKFGRYGGGIHRFETSLVQHSAGFDVNDLGFLRRSDQRDWSTWSALRWNDPTRAYRWLQVNGNHWLTWNTSGRLLQHAMNFNGHMGLHNNWSVHGGFTVDGLGATFCDRCTRGGPAVRESRGLRPWFGVNADTRRTLAPSLWVNLGFGDEGLGRTVSIEPAVTLRASSRLDGRIGLNWRRNEDANQWVGNFEGEPHTTHHTFAQLDQETVSANVRINYTAGRNLTFQLYGQPFVSRGTYSDFRELSATPEADAFRDRYVAYTPPASTATAFRFRQLRTNLVVRWEYRPGSTVYLAWAHGRQASDGHGSERSWTGEFNDLLGLHPDNTFLIKVAHWMNW